MTAQPYSQVVNEVIDEVIDRRLRVRNGESFLESRLVMEDEPGYLESELREVLIGEIAAEVSLRLLFRFKGKN